jgi:hypothetical protein
MRLLDGVENTGRISPQPTARVQMRVFDALPLPLALRDSAGASMAC